MIYTITLNPAYDVHAHAESLLLGHENFADIVRRDAGGKGINISRALTVNGVENTAIVVLGEENCADFLASLEADGIAYIGIGKSGRIRENLTIHTEDGETRISFAGFTLDNAVLDEIVKHITADENTIVTFTGSVPRGIDMTEIKHFLADLSLRGAKTVIDSRSFTLAALVEVKPWLIKPNGDEITVYSGKKVSDFSDCIDFVKVLNGEGIQNVMVSLGEKGALLVTDSNAIVATPPRIAALSTIGAGDSMIAGYITAYSRGDSAEECLRTAVAYGSAACLLNGTTAPSRERIEQIYQNTFVKKM